MNSNDRNLDRHILTNQISSKVPNPIGRSDEQNGKFMKNQRAFNINTKKKSNGLDQSQTMDVQSYNPDNGNMCSNGYNDDSSCIQSNIGNEDKLKDILEDLIKKGKTPFIYFAYGQRMLE